MTTLGAVDTFKADSHRPVVLEYVNRMAVDHADALRRELRLRNKGLAEKRTDEIQTTERIVVETILNRHTKEII